MDIVKSKWKRNIFLKAWQSCKLLGSVNQKLGLTKSKSWHCTTTTEQEIKRKNKFKVAPEGCFSVYVGPERQRFVIKTEFVNHPLFRTLLEDAEMEYGFDSQGPIILPCDVDLFYKVLAEMDSVEEEEEENIGTPTWSPLLLCSPSRRTGYRAVPHAKLLKLNRL